MRRILSRLATVGLSLVASIALVGCAAMSGPATSRPFPSELRVGMATNYPPLAFKADGQMQGVEVDFAQKLSKEQGTIGAGLAADLKRLEGAGIPVDVVFEQGLEVLGLAPSAATAPAQP